MEMEKVYRKFTHEIQKHPYPIAHLANTSVNLAIYLPQITISF